MSIKQMLLPGAHVLMELEVVRLAARAVRAGGRLAGEQVARCRNAIR